MTWLALGRVCFDADCFESVHYSVTAVRLHHDPLSVRTQKTSNVFLKDDAALFVFVYSNDVIYFVAHSLVKI